MKEVLYVSDSFRAFEAQDGIRELMVPKGWRVAWEKSEAPGVLHRPECVADDDLYRTAPYAAALRTRHATHHAAYHKTVPVNLGAVLVLTAYIRQLEERSGHAMRVGIDPTGCDDFMAPTVVWSDWRGHYDPDGGAFKVWEPLLVRTEAVGPEATMFLLSKTEWAMNNVAAFFDDVQLHGWLEEGAENEELISQLLTAVVGIKGGLTEILLALETLEDQLNE